MLRNFLFTEIQNLVDVRVHLNDTRVHLMTNWEI